MKVGKRPGMVAANALFLAGTIWTVFASTYDNLLVGRLLAAFGASAALGLSPTCISDISFLHERATKLGLYE
jgi:MFS family permease